MNDEQILKPLRDSGLIIMDSPHQLESLTCEEECQGKLAVAIAACSLLPDPLSKVACIGAAKRAYENCSQKCGD
ncbi:hypothetical protein [Bacillus sp. GBSW2]|uniref:hypothetical protein n=1 Tax=Bacillus sp. GBSW2 TaxID=2108541 RepID=UPI00115BECA8|nr:hypothetical protein [Bacillus sp. GBSW2]